MNKSYLKTAACISILSMLVGCNILGNSDNNDISPILMPSQVGNHAQLTGNVQTQNATDESSDNTDYSDESPNPDVSPESQIEESTSSEPSSSNKGDAEGTFKTTDIDGNVVTQEIFTKSKLNVVNVWGTYCGYCIDEMPYLGEIASSYKTSDVQIIGICCDVWEEDDDYYKEAAIDIIKETGADYLNVYDNSSIEDWKLNEVYYIPQTYLIDSEGKTLYVIEGSLYEDEWEDIIAEYLDYVS